jgi:hypothetical protein
VGVLLNERRTAAQERVESLRERLQEKSETRAKDKACVYITGSFGRLEGSRHSDLDLFIVGKSDSNGERLLKSLDEICIKADLIEASRALGFPDFDGDGAYLEHYTIQQLVKTLGKPEDDVDNTFTARVLLLLESYPLLEKGVYGEVIQEVINAYWRDYADHKDEFMPAFLSNDILRLWRTFCVNYEARTSTEPEEKKAKRKLKNYKLKHSRLLTCYSALLYLLAVFSDHQTVSPADAIDMIGRTPTGRLEWLLDQQHVESAHAKIRDLLECYESFLKVTDAPERDLVDQFKNAETSRERMRAAYKFGDLVFDVLSIIGQGHRFHRLLVV